MPIEVKWGISILLGLGLIALGWKVPFLLTGMFILICLLLVIVVLLQSGKAADLAGAFGGAGSQTAFGPRGAATFLSKATTWCAIMFMLMSLAMSLRQERVGTTGAGSVLHEAQEGEKAPATPQQQIPAPTTAPGDKPGSQAPSDSTQTPPGKQ